MGSDTERFELSDEMLEKVTGGATHEEVQTYLKLVEKICGSWIWDVYNAQGIDALKTEMQAKYGDKWWVKRCPTED